MSGDRLPPGRRSRAAPTSTPLVLASGSPHRRELLARLGVPFRVAVPAVEERHIPRERPRERATRLALEKAAAVAPRFPGAWVVGSDQVASVRGRVIDKPGTRERAQETLTRLAGREAVFHTGVCLLRLRPGRGGSSPAQHLLQALDVTRVRIRALGTGEIERYLDREPALDCAGGFKVEGLGITLLEQVRTTDPTGLVGLPLIALSRLLREAGLDPLAPPGSAPPPGGTLTTPPGGAGREGREAAGFSPGG